MSSTKNTSKKILLLVLVTIIGALLVFLNGQSIDLARMQVGIADVTQWRQHIKEELAERARKEEELLQRRQGRRGKRQK